jgi:hypothetical protein
VGSERRISGGSRRGLRLPALCANDHERYAADQGDAAENRRNGNGAGLLVFDFERAEPGVLLFVGEAEASDGKADDTDDDQNDADDGGRFHGVEILLKIFVQLGEMQICTMVRSGAIDLGMHCGVLSVSTRERRMVQTYEN